MTEATEKKSPKVPPDALADIRALTAEAQSAQQRIQVYLKGLFVGMGLQGEWNVDTVTGELTEIPKKG